MMESSQSTQRNTCLSQYFFKDSFIHWFVHHGVAGNSRQWYERNLWGRVGSIVKPNNVWWHTNTWAWCTTCICGVYLPRRIFFSTECSIWNVDLSSAVKAHWDLQYKQSSGYKILLLYIRCTENVTAIAIRMHSVIRSVFYAGTYNSSWSGKLWWKQ